MTLAKADRIQGLPRYLKRALALHRAAKRSDGKGWPVMAAQLRQASKRFATMHRVMGEAERHNSPATTELFRRALKEIEG